MQSPFLKPPLMCLSNTNLNDIFMTVSKGRTHAHLPGSPAETLHLYLGLPNYVFVHSHEGLLLLHSEDTFIQSPRVNVVSSLIPKRSAHRPGQSGHNFHLIKHGRANRGLRRLWALCVEGTDVFLRSLFLSELHCVPW